MDCFRIEQIAKLLIMLLLSTVGAYEGSSKRDHQDAVYHIDAAIAFYQRADVLPVHSKACEKAIKDALDNLIKAKSQAAQNDWKSVKHAVVTARNENAACILKLKADKAPLGRALSYLILHSEKKLAVADDKLGNKSPAAIKPQPSDRPREEVPKINPRQGCPPQSVDGTTCQYSSCAKGLGLPSCSIGYAKGVVGGMWGKTYVVTNDGDNPIKPSPGSLRYGTNLARGTLGVWITFERNMIINLEEMLWVQSRTTIDGRGFNVTINKRNLVVGDVRNVIIHNIQVNGIRGSDSIHIFAHSSMIWIDHVTSFAAELGLVSVLQGATDVTISNCNLQNQNFNMLLGASDGDVQDKSMRVSVYRNWFHDSTQRMPHCRWGSFHVANNLYTNWGYYAIGARVQARVLSERNAFVASRAPEVTPWFEGFNSETFDTTARIESRSDMFLNGTTFHQFLSSTQNVDHIYPEGAKSPPLVAAKKLPGLVKPCVGALFGSHLVSCLQR